MRLISYVLLTLFAFLSGFETLLPVHSNEIGAVRTSDLLIAGKLSIKEVVLLMHAALNVRTVGTILSRPRPVTFVICCVSFCALGLVSSLINSYPQDIPQALRFLLAAYFAQAFYLYSRSRGVETLLFALVTGMAAAGVVNLYYSFTAPRAFLGFLPLLWGQNGPGGYAGLMVGMALPLSMLASAGKTRRLVRIVGAGCAFITLISYSKLGMLMTALGLLAWGAHWITFRPRRTLARATAIVSILVAAVALRPAAIVDQFAVIYEYKFQDSFDDADMERLYYYLASTQTASTHLLGVSPSGIGVAFKESLPGRKGRLPEEEDVRNVNPHNSFLAFLAANGFLGLLPAIGLFLFWVSSIRRALVAAGQRSLVVWMLLVGSCVVFSNTLPGFFEVFFLHAIVLILHTGTRQVTPVSEIRTPVSQGPSLASP